MAKTYSSVAIPSGVWTTVYVSGQKIWVKHEADRNVQVFISLQDPGEDSPVEHKNVFEK